MGRASRSYYAPLCSPSSRRARQRIVVLTIPANELRGGFSETKVSDDPGHAVDKASFWLLGRSQNCSGLPRFETPTSRRLLRRRAEVTALQTAPPDIFLSFASGLLIGG